MKIYLLLIILLSFSTILHSQHKKGVFIGTNYSYFTDGFQREINAEDSFGIHIGVLYELALNDKISFRPKLSYSQQGDRVRTTSSSGSLARIDSKLNYLNVSLDFKLWDKIYLIAGPQLGFLLSQKKLSFDFGAIEKDIDLGINLGGGFRVDQLFFELGFYQGLTTLVSIPKSFSSNVLDVRNSHFKFTAGYNF